MSAENETAPAADAAETESAAPPQADSSEPASAADQTNAPEQASAPEQAEAEPITYHAVEKEGQVTAIWEMQGRKHLRTIDPRSRQGQEILRLYTTEHPEEAASSADTASA